jgi:hypothetical protein
VFPTVIDNKLNNTVEEVLKKFGDANEQTLIIKVLILFYDRDKESRESVFMENDTGFTIPDKYLQIVHSVLSTIR